MLIKDAIAKDKNEMLATEGLTIEDVKDIKMGFEMLEALEEMEWETPHCEDDSCEFEQWSPAGEDIIVSLHITDTAELPAAWQHCY